MFPDIWTWDNYLSTTNQTIATKIIIVDNGTTITTSEYNSISNTRSWDHGHVNRDGTAVTTLTVRENFNGSATVSTVVL